MSSRLVLLHKIPSFQKVLWGCMLCSTPGCPAQALGQRERVDGLIEGWING